MADAAPYLEATVRDQLVKALQALYREQPAKPFTFLSEFFAKAKAAAAPAEEKQQGQGKKQGKKKKKKVKIAKSDVVIEVTLDTEVEATWDEIEAGIKEIDLNGVMWPKQKFGLVDFVFGMKKMIVICQIVNAEVESTSIIVEAMKEVKGIGEANMVNIETAADDWGNKPRSKKQKQQQQSKKKGKKNKKKKAPAVRTVTPEFIAKDANLIKLQAKEATFYVAGCPAMDGSGQTNVTPEQLAELAGQVRAKFPGLGLMIVSAGSSEVTCYCQTPEGCGLAASDWASTAMSGAKATGDANAAFVTKVCDPEQDEFCIKIKDNVSSSAFAALRKAGVLEEASEEEFYAAPGDEEGY